MHSSSSCSTVAAFLLTFLTCLSLVFAQHHDGSVADAVCRPYGSCEPCPHDALKEPFCQPFGNRRLMHCAPSGSTPSRPSEGPDDFYTTHPDSQHTSDPPTLGDTLAWESCGRIVEKERADFWEFVACNVLFAAGALFLVAVRSKRLQALQARQLAARIGLVRGAIGGG
ncbi:hypothetical protein OF83DRAFT_1104689 [Amylostereum chailletii]|nr:hypothetical protein OF83DRAFT_1104689 [Amylostereum chailletii]